MKIGEALLGRRSRTYVIDDCSIVHTRPIGAGNSYVHQWGNYEARFSPQIYANRMHTLKKIVDISEVCFVREAPTVDQQGIDNFHAEQFRKWRKPYLDPLRQFRNWVKKTIDVTVIQRE